MNTSKKKLETHKQMAIKALEANPECRNSDLELLLQVLSDRGVYLNETQKYAIRNSGVEFKTLLRQRQLLQSEGRYMPTKPEVLKKRRKMAAEYAEHFSEL